MEQFEKESVLSVRGLSVSFRRYEKGLRQTGLATIRGLDAEVRAGELVAVVGSSGSGKSLLAQAILGILPYNAVQEGQLDYRGEPLTPKRQAALRGKEIVLVPQSVASLDPLMKVGNQVCGKKRDKTARQAVRSVFSRYGLDEKTEGLYPFELSGGMARRVLISTAVLCSPRLVIADEPTPGLHIDTARRVLSHFREMADGGAGVLLITHDLELALEVADRVVVFYAGVTVEEARTEDFVTEDALRHPYTKALWRAMPKNGFAAARGVQPYGADMPAGCPFAPRCALCDEGCEKQLPAYRQLRGGRVRCVRAK